MSTILILVFLFLFLFFILAVLFYLVYTSIIQPGAVYYPSTIDMVEEMVKVTKPTKKDTIMDLGSGDGRILIGFAKKGIRGVGYEIDPLLVYQSRKKIKKLGLSHLVKIRLKSFWLADFNQASIITLYLFPHYMDKLQSVLEEKLTHPIILISNTYKFSRKKYARKIGQLYLYKFP